MRPILNLTLLGLSLLVTGCSTLESDKVNYKSVGKAPSLEVPPDLTQLSRDSRYMAPGSAPVSASAYQQAGLSAPGETTAVTQVADARIERQGQQRWLVVQRPPEKLWDAVKDFWQESGFVLVRDDPQLGLLETEWAENRAKIPQDILRRALGKVIDGLYDTGERDKFRTRLERGAHGGTEIFISHRGMAEVYTSADKTGTAWQLRPSDPELEAEFLQRLLIKLGGVTTPGAAASGPTSVSRSAQLDTRQGQAVLLINENFERAWRRVGLSLDRTGFTVEDRDRGQGLYFVRYVEPTSNKEEPGFFSKLFSGAPKEPAGPQKYRISVKSEGTGSVVNVLTDAGAPETSTNAQRILKVLADDIK